jgi:hypothetical protein
MAAARVSVTILVVTNEATLTEALHRDEAELRARWQHRFSASPLRLTARATEDLFALGEPIGLALVEAARGPAHGQVLRLLPGSAELREVEKAAVFAGAAASNTSATGYDVAALLLALRDTLAEHAGREAREALVSCFEWLAVVALDAFASATRERALERAQGELERGTPVVLLPEDVPAAFLVGSPHTHTLEAVLGRLVLLAARVGARAVVIDGSGLTDPSAPVVLEALARLFRHAELRERADLIACGLGDIASERWQRLATEAGARVAVFERTDAAVREAMRAAHRSGKT